MSQDAKLRADKFARAMDDLSELFDDMEKQALDMAVSMAWQHQQGEENTRRLLERVKVIRDIRGNVKNAVTLANAAEEKVDAGPSPFA